MKKLFLSLGAMVLCGILFYRYSLHESNIARGAPDKSSGTSNLPTVYSIPIPHDSSLKDFLNRTAPIDRRIYPDMSSRFQEIKDLRDIKFVRFVALDTDDEDAIRNEAINLLRRSKAPEMKDLLLQILRNPKERSRMRAFAAQHLGLMLDLTESTAESHSLNENLTAFLEDDRDVEVRREALLALARNRDSMALRKTAAWLCDDSPFAETIRDLTIRCAYEAELREMIPEIRKYLEHPDEVTRIAAIATLGSWKDESSRSSFIKARESNSLRVRKAGEVALSKLNGP